MIKDLLEKAAKERAVEVIKQLLKDEEEQGDIFFTDEDKDALKLAIKALSVPAVPKGEWIPLYPRTVGEWEYKCSNCGHRGFMYNYNFCSDMRQIPMEAKND